MLENGQHKKIKLFRGWEDPEGSKMGGFLAKLHMRLRHGRRR